MGDTLPIDPRTGLQATAILPSGRILWPICGGDGTDGDGGTGGSEGDDDAGETGGGEPDYKAEAEKWKKLARKHEGTSKANAGAAAKLAELEGANKTELERERDKAAAAESRAKDAETRAARLEVAASKGLSPKLAARLVGTTLEELEADADELLAQLKPGEGSGSGSGSGAAGGDGNGSGGRSDSRGRPKENLRSGAAPDAEPEENDPKKLAELIPRG